MSRKPLLILGNRTLAVEVLDIVTDTDEFEVAGFVENMDRALCDELLEGLPVHWVDDIGPMARTHIAVCALGTTKRFAYVAQAAALGFRFATVVHPSARISRNSRLGTGTIVNAGVVVATHTNIGEHVILNRGALIGHHTEIGDYCSIMPGSNIAGSCTIGPRCYVGMGAIVIDHTVVGEGSVVAAGAVVTKDLPARVQVVGIPARIVAEGVDPR
jgi:sugar O-acyltransferase (sialic acid O-acetyltransferase NeuD family)